MTVANELYWLIPPPNSAQAIRPPNYSTVSRPMEIGELLIRSSVRLAMICYAGVLVGCVLGQHAPATTPASRRWWTFACALYWVHVLSAFAFYHHWSHAHAFADVAAQTKAALGVEFGWGLYVNHLFTLVWTIDSVWSWVAEKSYATRPRWLVVAVHGFMLFIVVNGFVVFKSGLLRWISATVFVGILALWAVVATTRVASAPTTERDGATGP